MRSLRGTPRRSSISSRRRHTRFLNVTGVQTCALPSDRKSTRRTPVTFRNLVCRLLLEKKKATKSEEHTSELQSHSEISYAVFCLKKKKQKNDLRSRNDTIYNIQIINHLKYIESITLYTLISSYFFFF